MTENPLSFLEASNLLAGFTDGVPQNLTFCLSGTSTPLELFLRAEATRHGVALTLKTLPYGILRQHLFTSKEPNTKEVFLLCPWDLVGVLDWRSGVPSRPLSSEDVFAEAVPLIEQFQERRPIAIYYLPAPIPPVGLSPKVTKLLAMELQLIALKHGAILLSENLFSLQPFLASGFPLASTYLGQVAQMIMKVVLTTQKEAKKVLVTDLDNTLWSGIIAEDELDGISAEADGKGFWHFLYQTLLRKFKETGILLAVVSRNDPETVIPALAPGRQVLNETDFVAILTSYNPKSAQIVELSKRLNISLSQFVFVDDNPVELEEVSGALPEVKCLAFQSDEKGFLVLFEKLHQLFRADSLTEEDLNRTELYRNRASGILPVKGRAHDITNFLADLNMTLTLHNRSTNDFTRALQLINKTNQFNMNGHRWDSDDAVSLLASGGKLYTASLADRFGSHGEILAMLLDANAAVKSFVMSCRVFQRCVENMFLLWILDLEPRPLKFNAQRTEKNEPFWQFLVNSSFSEEKKGVYSIDVKIFQQQNAHVNELFKIVTNDN